jgi:hypothetical protein
MANSENTSFVKGIQKWFEDTADWVQENLGDPAIAASLRDDLGLAPGEDIPKAQNDQIQQFAKGFDPDKTSFEDTVSEIIDAITALKALGDQIKDGSLSGWDVAYLIGKVAAADSIRLRWPLIYAIGKATTFITDDPEQVTQFDPAVLVNIASGKDHAMGTGEQFLQRLTSGVGLAFILAKALLEKPLGLEFMQIFYGWDPSPGSPTPNADLVSERAMTFVFTSKGPVAGKLALTLLGVPPETAGPALLLSLGGGISATEVVDKVEYKLETGAGGALNLFIPFSKNAQPFSANGDPNAYLKISATRQSQDGSPALRIGEPNKTRLDIGALGFGVDLLSSRAGFRLNLQDVALVINLGDGDGFMQQLPQNEIKLQFNLGLTVDTQGGLRLDGGTLLRATIPLEKSLGGVLNIYHIDFALGPKSGEPDMAVLELSTALSLKLGPFQASVDRLGFNFFFAFREGNLGFMQAKLGFKPPNGIGLLLDAGVVKGGGYLYFDFERGEYAGALELKFAAWGIKAIGLLSTRNPDGSPGFALLLLIYADLPRFHIAFGIFFDGIGGLIGLNHGPDITALQNGIPSGVFDDILFPENPVADAPRIINRLRVVFPVRPHAFMIGAMFRLSWGTKPANFGEIKLGLVLTMDNVLGGDRPVSLSSILLLGQLRIGLPNAQLGLVVGIICDFMGYLDFDNKRFGFYAALRDSRLVKIYELTGSLVLLISFGDHPTFVVAAGGFHPRFHDLPEGLPSRLDRIGLKFDISIVKVSLQFYFAMTSATVQFGANLSLRAELGPILVEGGLGFDALIYTQPRFRFEIDFHAGMSIKFKGHTLMGVTVTGTLSGPGQWHIVGKATFTILFWDFDVSFDEQWGDAPVLPATTTQVQQLLQDAYNDHNNWSARLPSGADTMVTLSAAPGDKLLAHPLSQLHVGQKVAPLGVTLEKYGETQISGPNRFELQQVTIGGEVVVSPIPAREFLARSTYLNLNDEQRLTQPSFEQFDVGFSIGTDHYSPAPEDEPGDLSYETLYLEPAGHSDFSRLIRAEVDFGGLSFATFQVHVRQGAAAQSGMRAHDALRPKDVQKVILSEPSFTIVNQANLSPAAGLDLGGLNASNFTVVQQHMLEKRGVAAVQIVESHEIA